MFSFILKVRRKNEQERRRFVILTSSIVTGIIALFWLLGFSSYLESEIKESQATEDSKNEALVHKTSSALNVIGDSTKSAFFQVKNFFSNLGTVKIEDL